LPPFSLVSSCSASLPAPLSFPTRRSSDLSQTLHPHPEGETRVNFRVDANVTQHVRMHHPATQHFQPFTVFTHDVNFCRRLGEREDRKSTRLNSSHVSISYAVFCLKKKKHK